MTKKKTALAPEVRENPRNIRLSPNFIFAEFLHSNTAINNRIDNTPCDKTYDTVLSNATALAKNVLQPIRAQFGPTVITSGYSNTELNRLLGRGANTQHGTGEAADIQINGVSMLYVAKWVVANLKFDQLILERRVNAATSRTTTWIHVSFKADGNNRNQVLYSPRSGVYTPGLPDA
jgi:hypothetical protein